MKRAARRAHGEEGFTLPELIMAIAILAIIIAPLSLALITGLRVVGKADEKYNDSRGSLISAAYFANDVSNANTITKGASAGCGGSGAPIVSFAWTDARNDDSADVDAPESNTVTYAFDSSDPLNQRLLRKYCPNGGAAQQSVAAISLGEAPVVTCFTSNSGGAPIENAACDKDTRWVQIDITAKPNSPTPANLSPIPYTYTLQGTRRPT
jgi:prepilin-type N-terminal cleavage/methylation domain-containing protein